MRKNEIIAACRVELFVTNESRDALPLPRMPLEQSVDFIGGVTVPPRPSLQAWMLARPAWVVRLRKRLRR